MPKIQRPGGTSLIVLVVVVFLSLFIIALIAMTKQAKASDQLKKQVIEQANKMVASGISVDASTLPTVKSAAISRQRTKTYQADGISFSYPEGLKVKDFDANYRELGSDERYFNSSVVPSNQLLVKVRTNLRLSLNTIEDYLKQAPYAVTHETTIINQRQVLLITNRYKDTVWQQAVIADSPQGPYHFVTVMPGQTASANDTLQLITTTFKSVGS